MTYPTTAAKSFGLSHEQEIKLETLKLKLIEANLFNSKHHDAQFLYRFLKARNFSVVEGFAMIENYEKWRKEKNVDGLVEDFELPHENEIAKIYPRFYHGLDRLGRPVHFELINKFDINKVFSLLVPGGADTKPKYDYAMDLLMKHFIVKSETLITKRLPSCSEQAGKKIDQCYSIIDVKGITLNRTLSLITYFQEISNVYENYYPELMFKAVIINAPFTFRGIFTLIKPFISQGNLDKISIVGSNYMSILEKDIDIKNIPKFYGGACTCQEICCDASILN